MTAARATETKKRGNQCVRQGQRNKSTIRDMRARIFVLFELLLIFDLIFFGVNGVVCMGLYECIVSCYICTRNYGVPWARCKQVIPFDVKQN